MLFRTAGKTHVSYALPLVHGSSPGVAVKLFIVQEPSSETSNVAPLEDQPVVVLLDAAENPVTHPKVPKGAGLIAQAHTVPAMPNATTPTAVFADGAFAFRCPVSRGAL